MGKIKAIKEVAISELKPYERNAKLHNDAQVEKIAKSIEEFGFLSPCLIDTEGNVIAGHGRIMAAAKLGMKAVPCVYIEGLTDAQRRAYILADNRLTELGEWDEEIVQQELAKLNDEGFDVELTGFTIDEPDTKLDEKVTEQVNLVETLPESKIYVCAVSAFGTSSEKIVQITIPKADAERFLARCDEVEPGKVGRVLLGAINGL